jgi:D-aminoacyl-tRNA deacylase
LFKGERNVILLVSSKNDVASVNIANEILGQNDFSRVEDFQDNPAYEAHLSGSEKVKLITLRGESVNAQDLTSFLSKVELAVFISRHKSESGTPTLSVHTPGNLGSADLGGIPRRVSIAPANAMRNALRKMCVLKDEFKLNYDVSYECTHHGPSLDVPAMFAELGSSPLQWNDPAAAGVVAQAAIEAIKQYHSRNCKTVLGIGGPHYNAKFTRMALKENVAFGHIIPKYAIATVDAEILEQCIQRTLEKVEAIILDWKGIRSEDKATLIRTLDNIELPVEKV